jgi:secreted Zn-dependent insulinase-like peptidase
VQGDHASVLPAQCAQIAAQLMQEAAFAELRTKQQLGYTVAVQYQEHAGMCTNVIADSCASQDAFVCDRCWKMDMCSDLHHVRTFEQNMTSFYSCFACISH